MTASEASRNFSALLDAIERGETIAVTRNGARVATIAPAERGTWAAFTDVVQRHRGERRVDDESMERSIAEMRKLVSHEHDRDPWSE